MHSLILFCLATLSLTALSGVEGPRVQYQWREQAKLSQSTEEFKGAKASYEMFSSFLIAPVIKSELFLFHGYGLRRSNFRGLASWRYNEIETQGYSRLGVLYTSKNEFWGGKPILSYAQWRNPSFSFPYPVHVVGLGMTVKSAYIADILKAKTASDLTLFLRIRYFPTGFNNILVARQRYEWDSYALLLVFPFELRFSKRVSSVHEIYSGYRFTDQNVFPFDYGDLKGWNAGGYSLSAFLGLDVTLVGALHFFLEIGSEVDNVDMLENGGETVRKYRSEPAGWGQLRLVGVF